MKISEEEGSLGIGALENMLRVGAMFVIPADRFDAGTFSKGGGDPAIFYYENYPGGIGVAKKLFGVWLTALEKGIEIARECSCRHGCVNCIEPPKAYINANIDKEQGIALAESIFIASQNGPDRKLSNGLMRPI